MVGVTQASRQKAYAHMEVGACACMDVQLLGGRRVKPL